MLFRADYSKQTTVLIGQSEGLPNITGTMTPTDPKYGAVCTFSGAFIDTEDKTNQYVSRGNADYSYVNGWKFDASRSNPIYGNNAHVTPCNATIKVWQRIS